MPEERDIEKSLRAWAKRRREDAGPPLDLHPATRQLLQAEVARLRGGPRRERSLLAQFLWGSPRRLAFNLATTAALLVAAVIVVTQFRPAPAHIAAADEASVAMTDRKMEPNAPASGQMAQLDKLQRPALNAESGEDAAKDTAEKAPTMTNSVVLADSGIPANTATRQLVAEPRGTAGSEMPAAAVPTPAAQPAAPPTLALAKTPGPATVTFASQMAATNSPAVALASKKYLRLPQQDLSGLLADRISPASVLVSFRLEQTAGQLRIIDADGSIYTGNLPTQQIVQQSDASQVPSVPISFHVSGTNLTLNQLIVFDGSFVAGDQAAFRPQSANTANRAGGASAAPGASVGGFAGGGGGGFGGAAGAFKAANQTNFASAPAAATAATTALPALLNYRIQGRAFVGTNEIQIIAAPVQP